MENILVEEGFHILEICSDYTHNAPSRETIMINFIVKKSDS